MNTNSVSPSMITDIESKYEYALEVASFTLHGDTVPKAVVVKVLRDMLAEVGFKFIAATVDSITERHVPRRIRADSRSNYDKIEDYYASYPQDKD